MKFLLDVLLTLFGVSSVIGTVHGFGSDSFKQAAGGLMEGLNKLEGLLDAFESVTTKCVYKCPNGAKPKPNPHHVPSYNGCGTMGLELVTEGLPEMTKCCNKHDICYDTCGVDRIKCDEDFNKCLHKMCKKYKSERNMTKRQMEGCKTTAELMSAGTLGLGCQAFLDAQKEACSCDQHRRDEF
ncbi:group XIIA secretory phospholipase A2-like [Ptychodera flava]|uniref:group XIIA secretory phospholipase A2-like n=1 Tax=Ptychodera flava TaxID=63121 RepID=UPI00396A9452